MRNSKFTVIALLSMTLLGLELVWTRVFAAEYFYTFAFLSLSLAIMGLGIGALALRLFPSFNKNSLLGVLLSLSGLMALIGPPTVIHLGMKFSGMFNSFEMFGKLLFLITILASTFFFGGMALALLFRRNHKEMPRLYMADLLGAGAGVILGLLAMNLIGTAATVFWIALPVLIAAVIASIRWLKILPVALLAVMVLFGANAKTLLDSGRDPMLPLIYEHWDAMAKIQVHDYGDGEHRNINIDNVANSPVTRFDGNWDRPDSLKFEFNLPVDYLIGLFDSCTFLSLGSGGGADVLQALQEGATEIHATEVIPHINHMMIHGDSSGYFPTIYPPPPEEQPTETTEENDSTDAAVSADSTADNIDSTAEAATAEDEIEPEPPFEIMTLAEFTGHIYDDPRVTAVTEDARVYVGRYENKFDIIYSLSSNTFSALASGSFAMAENYLFTTEAIEDYWAALSDSGFLVMEHQFYVPRLVGSATDALAGLGVEDVESHIAVYDLPQRRRNILLLSKRPLDDSLRYHAFWDLQLEHYDFIHLLYPAPDSLKDNIPCRIITEGWQNVGDSARIDLSPATDNRPFVAQMGLWRNFEWDKLQRVSGLEVFGFPISKLLILLIMSVVLLILIPLNLIPYFISAEKLKAVPWLYFFFIGAAFMIIEVILTQQYARFIGPSVYSIATVLLTLLIASGIGSRFSRMFGDRTAFIGIIAWVVLNIIVFEPLVSALAGLTIWPRILIAAVLLAPLGFFMGMPFPKGSLRVGELIDWGFAVNGAASVLGATGILLVAMAYGFSIALLVGAALYFVAMLLHSYKSAW
ncbi:MAG: hypothetical protein GY839_02690 [candidate division Zixibacteria bacterium]|nr:hypothetical protein [candidate division Zixibacteria bacterium]